MQSTNQKSASEEEFDLKPYAKGDEADILELFLTVYGAPKSASHWRWQFELNPNGPGTMVLAREKQWGGVVGHYSAIPVGLNISGHKKIAAQSIDTMVHPTYRRHGIFEASAQECYLQLASAGASLVYGFPNRASFPGYVRKLKWSRICFLNRYYLKLSILKKVETWTGSPLIGKIADQLFRPFVWGYLNFRRLGCRRRVRGMRVESSDTVPKNYDELWDSVKSFEVLSLWKDAAYFRWRYDDNPSYKFKYYYLQRDGRIEAICVVIDTGGNFEVLELLTRDRDVEMARYLVLSVAMAAHRAHASRLTFAGSDLDFFDHVFKKFSHEKSFQHVFCLAALERDIKPLAVDHCNWTVTLGDSDCY